ncbi:IS1 family transposase, partial [Shigella sonnei]|uniref:IS1 family transposase n=1 Tax=Shigella sonnei TaxID=624 RepID=UPI00338E905D
MASVSISCPSCSATDGVVRNGKSTAGHQLPPCTTGRQKTTVQFTYPPPTPTHHPQH